MPLSGQRLELIKTILEDEAIAAEEEEILHLLLNERVTRNLAADDDREVTFGQRAADGLARFAGSWAFILIFFLILVSWIVLNSLILTHPYDSYPFILLNLILSCLAAIQAPVIMMSQNRQEEKDRQRANNDYKVNLKAEIIILDIHEKLDSIIENQQTIADRLAVLEGEARARGSS